MHGYGWKEGREGGLRGRKERILGIGNARDQKLHTSFLSVRSCQRGSRARKNESE